MRHVRWVGIAQVLVLASGIGCSSASPDGASTKDGKPSADAGTSGPPAPMSGNAACVISADCPSGQYCDLEQCVQACSTKTPCASGLTCTSRGQCEKPGTPPGDPTPSGKYQGTLTVSPQTVSLDGASTSLPITLTSSSSQPVRYRVVVDGPHLAVAQTSGEFTGTTTVQVKVDSSTLKGSVGTGDVKIYTTLGDAVVSAPIHVGVTGSFKGTMRYDAGPITLGDVKLSVDLIESSGAVQARVNSQDSLLFPATASGDSTGTGVYSASSGVDVTIVHVIDGAFGGSSNPFGRSVGRSVRFRVKADSLGGLSGTFDETIAGLFAEPITTSGHVSLQYVPTSAPPSFSVADASSMPASPSATQTVALDKVLGFGVGDCFCQTGSAAQTISSMQLEQSQFGAPLLTSFQNQTSSDPTKPFFENIATACADAMGLSSLSAYGSDSMAHACGLPQLVACAQQCGAAHLSPEDAVGGPLVGQLSAQLLQAPLLVAKNELVDALKDSFTGGLTQESTHYTNAMKALAPYTAWMLQPAVIEFLRSMPASAAQGPTGTGNTAQTQPYPSVRALADLFYTSALVRGEQDRITAATAPAGQITGQSAQQQGLITYLEAAVVSEILRQWATVPSAVSSQFTGVLTPLDQGFSSLLEGRNVFGVPDGFVPFVYRPEDVGKGATNFEQMLAMASNAVSNENAVETQFLADARAYDTAVSQLQQELVNVKTQFDERIAADCGTTFDPNAVTGPDDPGWSKCGGAGKTFEGAVGQAQLAVQQAASQLASAQSRIQGQKQKIGIDVSALAQAKKVQSDTLSFISDTGQQISALDYSSGLLDAAMAATQVASNASIANLGAPLAEAGIIAAIGAAKADLTRQRDQLQTAQTMQIQMAQDQMADIAAMANIQKEEIDLAQAGVDITQQVIGIAQSQLVVTDKVAEAKEIWNDRQRQLAVIAQDPTHDPSYRLLRDSLGEQVLTARSAAQQQLYLAMSALQYEIDTSIAHPVGAAMNATNAANLGELQSCLLGIFNASRVAYGSPQDYVTTVSVRQMLGISGSRLDPVTGQTLSEGDQFRLLLLKNQNLDGQGGVGIAFSTDLMPGNGLWASDVCDDRLASVQAQLVGDFLGDNEAQVNLTVAGGAVLRSCAADNLTTWSLGGTSDSPASSVAVIQAGVNTFGEAMPNTALFGQSVARANWTLVVPGGKVAPANADVDLTKIDDIVLRFDHKALARQSAPVSVDLSCLGNVGQ